MKSVLISINPKWVEKIVNGEKTIEVRKTKPNLSTPFKCYIYATKSGDRIVLKNDKVFEISKAITGKVIGEFVCDKIVKYDYQVIACAKYEVNGAYVKEELRYNAGACLTAEEMFSYSKGKPLYGWHISDLKIYDKPKELSEFKTPPCEKSEKSCEKCKYLVKIDTPDTYEVDCFVFNGRHIERPPQSWQYVEVEE